MQSGRIKKFLVFFTFIFICMFLCGCMKSTVNPATVSDKPKVVAVSFPPYDFARNVAGTSAEVTMLLKPGTESHSYEPTPSDIIKIKECDIFIYTGGESDVWVDEILDSVANPDMKVIKMIDCVEAMEEEHVEGMQHAHKHDEHDEYSGHEFEYDEHVWTSPRNAALITKKIAEFLCETDEENREEYTANSENYIRKLDALNNEFEKISADANNKMLIFADRFPFRYFTDEYGFEYRAAFPGCSSEAEPSAKTVSYLIDKVNADNINYVFYIEFSNRKIADAIEEETGAKPLMLHSCHNITADEFENGTSYLELMYNNAKNLKEAFSL